MSFSVPNNFRITSGELASRNAIGNNGAFLLRSIRKNIAPEIFCIASDEEGFEHVSVSIGAKYATRTPTWEEMAFVKSKFWDADDCVMQLHPPQAEYVNNHNYCLHLWRPINADIPMPDSILVGIKGLSHDDVLKIMGNKS